MTKVIVLGAENWTPTGDKPIVFDRDLTGNNAQTNIIEDVVHKMPQEYLNIVLLSRDYCGIGLDLMYAYDIPHFGVLYLGHFNDGVV